VSCWIAVVLYGVRQATILAGVVAILILAVLSSPFAHAQIAPSFADDSLFRTMLASPSNPDATLQYAVNTKKVGDIEASIGALERLLFYNSTLFRVRFELGTLYFRLGSYEMARGYFQTAQASSDATPELKQRAQEFIDTIDKKLQPDQWSGFAQTGLRYQTNASLGPNQQSLIGATRPINSQFVAHPDWNWFGIFRVNYVHDFGTQSGDVFEANLLGYDAQQFKNTAVDAGLLDLRIGPRFGILQNVMNGASIKLYVVATGATLADAPYLGSYGGGITMHANLANVAFDPYVEFRRLDYRSSGLYPLASGLDGTLATYALQAGGPIFQGLRWQARFAFNRADDAFPWYSYDRYAFDFWLPCTVPSPWGGRSWVVTPSFGVAPWLYRIPDPTMNPTITEHDLEWRVGVGLDIPLRDRFGLGVQVQYRAINSNIPLNTVKDLSITLGPTVSF
jgi:tetratricopeptide (TPR) repeat protein